MNSDTWLMVGIFGIPCVIIGGLHLWWRLSRMIDDVHRIAESLDRSGGELPENIS